ncbi:hypothetical protein GCM10010201_34080 [Pilimelia columellifera subsp. columellifera]|uniref:Uncharacterized protein n=1 Tax=Pilimelia columellifera subsp. columellifera TaxID=706583 RepID=A0ABN3NR04_9ACTN
MKRLITAAVVLASLAATFIASPAKATGKNYKGGVELWFTAPKQIKKCRLVRLQADVFSAGESDVYWVGFQFKRTGTSRYVNKRIKSVKGGQARAFPKQCFPGTWRATVFVGDWTGPSVTRSVKVRR